VEGLRQAVDHRLHAGDEPVIRVALSWWPLLCRLAYAVGLHTLGLDREANDFFHLLSGLGNRARRVTDDTNSGTAALGNF
jgi:hypothetical protein